MRTAAEQAKAKPDRPSDPPAVRPDSKRRLRRLPLVPTILLALLVLTAALAAALPFLAEAALNQQLEGMIRQGTLRAEVKRLGIFGGEVALRGGPDDGSGRTNRFEALGFSCSPGGLLFRREIDAVTLRGIRIPAEFSGGKLSLPLLTMFRRQEKPTAARRPFRLTSLPLAVGKLTLEGILELVVANRPGDAVPAEELLIPARAEVAAAAKNWEELHWQISVGAAPNTLAGQGKFFGAAHRLSGRLEGALDSAYLPCFVRAFLPGGSCGKLRVRADFDCDLEPFRLHTLRGELEMPLRLDLPGSVTLAGTPRLAFTADHGRWEFRGNGPTVRAAGREFPPPILDVRFDGAARKGDGALAIGAADAPTLRLPFTFRRTPERAWLLELRAESRAAMLQMEEAKLQITLQPSGSIQAAGTLRNLKFADPAGNYRLTLPKIHCDADWHAGKAAALLQIEPAAAVLPRLHTELRDIALRLPLHYPADPTRKGSLTLGALCFQGQDLGRLQAEISFPGSTLASLQGAAEIGGLHADFAGEAGGGGDGFFLEGRLSVPEQLLKNNAALDALAAAKIDDLQYSARAALSGSFAVHGGKPSGQCVLTLRDGRVSSAKQDLEVTGLALRFALPALPALKTETRQTVRCESIRRGAIQTGAALLQLRMDAPDAWCLERMVLNWCGGKIRSEYLSFNPRSRRIPLTIHCDRLDMVSFLTQMGAGKGRSNGGGRISGTLPVVYGKDGTLTVGDGFLYSTPGEEGNIQLEFSDAVKETQTANPVFDMTQEALRDFHYSWAKINMASEKEMLKIKMQLNGKPGKPLYYTYGAGGIAKTDVPHIFQGIMLDVNLSLPLTDLMELAKRF